MSSRARKKAAKRARPPESRRHHYVPAGYIAFFAEPRKRGGKIHVWDRALDRKWISTPDNVAHVRDFYRLDPGSPPNAIEDELRKIEGKIIDAIRTIEARPLIRPTSPEVEAIVSFVTLQYLRGPDRRDPLEAFMIDVSRQILRIATRSPDIYERHVERQLQRDPRLKREDLPTYQEAHEAFRGAKFPLAINNGYLTIAPLRIQDTLFRLTANMRLGFYWTAADEELITTDQPVFLLPHPDTPPHFPVGWGTAKAILMPLTAKLLFIAWPEKPEIIASPAVPRLAFEVNRLLAEGSRQVYSHRPFSLEVDSAQPDDPNVTEDSK